MSYLHADKCFNLNGGTNVHGCEVCKQMAISCRQEMYGVHVLAQFFDWGGYDMKDLRIKI